MRLNADLSSRAVSFADEAEWRASPLVGVQRRVLERGDGRKGRATGVVRYHAGSRFPPRAEPLGEEFLVLLPNTAQQAAAELAETLRSAVAQCPCAREGCAITATVSIGVCGGQLHGTEDWERLLRCADQALYAAKAAGRNRVVAGRFVPEPVPPLATPVA